MQEYLFPIPLFGNLDIFPIRSHRVFFRQKRRLRVTGTEFVRMIRVECISVTVYFPVCRDINLFPCRIVKICFIKVYRAFFVGGNPVEFPFPIEGFIIGGSIEIVAPGFIHITIGHEGRPGIFFSDKRYGLVLPFRFHLHECRGTD